MQWGSWKVFRKMTLPWRIIARGDSSLKLLSGVAQSLTQSASHMSRDIYRTTISLCHSASLLTWGSLVWHSGSLMHWLESHYFGTLLWCTLYTITLVKGLCNSTATGFWSIVLLFSNFWAWAWLFTCTSKKLRFCLTTSLVCEFIVLYPYRLQQHSL